MLGALVAIKTAEYARKAKQYADPNGPDAELVNSAKAKIDQCPDGFNRCIDGAGKFVNEQTGGKYADKVNLTVDKAKGLLATDPQKGSVPDGSADGPSDESEPEDSARPESPARQQEPNAKPGESSS